MSCQRMDGRRARAERIFVAREARDTAYAIVLKNHIGRQACIGDRMVTHFCAQRRSEIGRRHWSYSCLRVLGHAKAQDRLGVMGINIPERWGRLGVSPTGMLLALVEISRACAATLSMIGAHYLETDKVPIGGNNAKRDI